MSLGWACVVSGFPSIRVAAPCGTGYQCGAVGTIGKWTDNAKFGIGGVGEPHVGFPTPTGHQVGTQKFSTSVSVLCVAIEIVLADGWDMPAGNHIVGFRSQSVTFGAGLRWKTTRICLLNSGTCVVHSGGLLGQLSGMSINIAKIGFHTMSVPAIASPTDAGAGMSLYYILEFAHVTGASKYINIVYAQNATTPQSVHRTQKGTGHMIRPGQRTIISH